jgi:hypothetical protein
MKKRPVHLRKSTAQAADEETDPAVKYKGPLLDEAGPSASMLN